MVSVAPPRRSEVYSLATADGSTGYTPGKIVPLELSVTRKQIMGKRNRGEANSRPPMHDVRTASIVTD